MGEHEEDNAPSSPACSMHEFADELLPRPRGSGPDWPAVQAFRKEKRAELLERRRSIGFDDRKRYANELTERLLAAVDLHRFRTLGFYWPIRGELDLRPIAQRHIAAGGAAALHGDSSTDSLTTTTLGLRGATELAMGAHTARLTAGLGWRHAGGDVNPKTSLAFIQGSGSSFNVSGAPIARDAAVLDLGAEMAVGKRTTVGLSYGGQYGAGNSDSAGNLYLKMRF